MRANNRRVRRSRKQPRRPNHTVRDELDTIFEALLRIVRLTYPHSRVPGLADLIDRVNRMLDEPKH